MREKIKILILEDIPEDAELIEHELLKENIQYSSKRVSQREDFIKELHNFIPDLVLSDYNLPQFDGLSALKIVKEIMPEIPFIIVTGSLNEEMAVFIMKSGAWDYVIKEHLVRLGPAVREALKLKSEIEKRTFAEIKLRESEEKFRTVANYNYDWEYWTDPELNFIHVSPSCKRITGYSPEEFYQNKNLMLKIVHPDDLSIILNHCQNTTNCEGVLPVPIDFRIITREGDIHWIGHVCQKVYNSKGKFLGIRGSNRDITERKKAEDQIRKDLEEKVILLAEIHHRVKNNLQIVSSLLKLQSDYITDMEVKEIFKKSENRVRSMALVHQKLYESKNFISINFNNYVQGLARKLFLSYKIDPDRIILKLDIMNIKLDLTHAVPVALILNELISNSLKYAFPDDREGEIVISMQSDNSNYILSVSDNGIGLPEKFNLETSKSFGMNLISLLAIQLNGQIAIKKEKGTFFEIKFQMINTKD